MTVTLTKTSMIAGVCEGIFAGVIDAPPQIAVTHHGEQVDGAVIKKAAQSDDWVPWPKISVKRWHCCAKSWTCSKAHFAGTASKPHSLTWRSG